ncbi:MAG: MFS transporter [Xanthobacteraceae bacterium]|nr:MFS transporter [Xanthobacteraceae bacterium]
MNRVLVVVGFIAFSTSLFMRAIDPVVPQISGEFGIPAAEVALLATVFALPFAIIQPLLGPVGDFFGKTKLMLVGTALLVAATFVGALAQNFTWLLASRLMAGIAAGGIFPAALAFVSDSVAVERRQIMLGRFVAAALAGNLTGAWAGGLIGDFTNWRGVLVAVASCGTLALVLGLWGFRGVKHEPGERFDLAFALNSYKAIFSNAGAKFTYLGVLLEGIAVFGLFPFVAILLHQSGEYRATIAGFVIAGFAIGGAMFGLVVPQMLKIFGTRGLMIWGSLLVAAMLCVSTLRLMWPLEFAAFMVMGVGFYMMHSCFQLAASELAPKARGSALALHSSFFFTGHAIGPLFYYYGLAHAGVTLTLIGAAAIVVATGVIGAQGLYPKAR